MNVLSIIVNKKYGKNKASTEKIILLILYNPFNKKCQFRFQIPLLLLWCIICCIFTYWKMLGLRYILYKLLMFFWYNNTIVEVALIRPNLINHKLWIKLAKNSWSLVFLYGIWRSKIFLTLHKGIFLSSCLLYMEINYWIRIIIKLFS